ncbi:hypothetical protein BAUCODRAFT_29260 [Baudoinia panamericana UAMH 10762]|uniref:Amidohydrolase 3 domain-containing protein n=1 Tax=Baudoinia panamericana (strain UAMH 10762) TaxID=717646 RepID=M2NNR5_BAUPA|nr:uncharacterized protein BAUCODRAFT_29260 [Baudoinia panamericana UAMH 10762]EMD00876.1 hypothetical protein BAUCODRAFT_29260 [Baudoinia panamericana UAMH 10762]
MDLAEKEDTLPRYTPRDEYKECHATTVCFNRRRRRIAKLLALILVVVFVYHHWNLDSRGTHEEPYSTLSVDRLRENHATCAKLQSVPDDPSGHREFNARFQAGNTTVLVRNATIWTGEPVKGTSEKDARAGNGWSWIRADVLMERGLITKVAEGIDLRTVSGDCEVWEAHGRLVTSGIVDMHSHAGDDPLPSDLSGGSDDNELSSDITPYVRSIDGINPLDPQIQVIKSGGVTTSLVLPGSGNNMGGEAFVIKHAVGKPDGRPEISVEDLLADPDRNWRYMKMACGENPKRVYGRLGRDFGPFSRLGEAWEFRHAFEQASNYVKSQDDWCAAANRVGAENMRSYLPTDLKWESLGAVLRGQVRVNTHCYTIDDLQMFVGLTNEFKFPVRAFHHAHQAYIVPELLKRAYNVTPAAALFADNMYYKVEAYTASEQAGKILYENGITPLYVSDNPVLNAQHVVFEAAKAYRNGLPYHAALAAVTAEPARVLGLGERIGKLKEGFDADIVVWDSDPLSVGATPVQVWIDGVPQFAHPVELSKPILGPIEPNTALQHVHHDFSLLQDVVISGVQKVWLSGVGSDFHGKTGDGTVVVRNGSIACLGDCVEELAEARMRGVKSVHIENGHITSPITSFGSFLGLSEISAEDVTNDGDNNVQSFSAAVDGLAFDTKSLAAAYRHGVTRAITAPSISEGGHKGVSAGFKTGAKHSLEKGAVWASQVAAHYTPAKTDQIPSLSGAIDALRYKLWKALKSNATADVSSLEERTLKSVVNGSMALVISTHSADRIASLLRMKYELDAVMPHALRLVIYGGAESHILAKELAAANVGVVLTSFAYGLTWDQRRALSGAPLTNGTAVDVLYAAGAKVAMSTAEDWETRDLSLLAGIIAANGVSMRADDGTYIQHAIGEEAAWSMVSSNIYEMLGLKDPAKEGVNEFVVYEGSPLQIDGRVRAIADGRGSIDVWL